MPGDIKSTESSPYTDSYVAILAKDVKLQGFIWPAGTRITILGQHSGDIGGIEFPQITIIKGFPVIKMWLWKFESIQIDNLELPSDHTFGGYLWPKGSGLHFHYDSKEIPKLWYVMLGEDSMFDGKKYKKRDYLWFNKEGKIDLTAPKPKPLY